MRYLLASFALLASLSTTPAVAQSLPGPIVQGSDGTLYLVTSAGRYTITPAQLSDNDLAALPDLGTLGADPPPVAVVTAPAPPVVSNDNQAAPVSVLDFVAINGLFGTTVAGTVESHSSTQTLSRVPLQISLFDPVGALVKSDTTYVTLDPAQKRGFSTTVLTDKNQLIGRVTVQALTGSTGLPPVRPDLTIDRATFKPGPFGNHAQAQFHNNGDKDITGLLVDVIAFDSAGKVIGGGLALAAAIPAHGVVLVEGALDAPGVPARIEMYPNWD